MLVGIVIGNAAVVVEVIGEGVVGRSVNGVVGIERRRVGRTAAAVFQSVTSGRGQEVGVSRIGAVDEVIAVVHDNVIHDQYPARVRRLDHVLQVGQAAPVGRDVVEVPRRVADRKS